MERKADVVLEAHILYATEKAYLIGLTCLGPDQCWVPRKAIKSMERSDPYGNFEFEIAGWWAAFDSQEWLHA